MATATVTRPAQALRNRAPRPSFSKRQNTMDIVSEPANKKRKLTEPYVRDSQYILEKHKGKQPSLTIHLHAETFRFDGQDISWTYDSPMNCVIKHLKEQTVPHEMMEELLSPAIQWYDGCLIVEVHNHRAKPGKERGREDSVTNEGVVKFGMHNYNPHVTPSPMVPFPSKAVVEEAVEPAASNSEDMPAPDKPKDKEGPTITTFVLHPTPLSQHHEMLILMKTPADQLRSKKKGNDGGTPSTAQPPTPSMSVPPTPLTQTMRGPLASSQKMCLEEGDMYTFQSDLLIATEPPLYLEPVDNPQDAEKVLEILQHPLHQAKPPSLKNRKRTTAEVAADDAQAAETERRMLIMDERIKPAGAGTGVNENQSAAASLGFSRFKTIEMVRQRHEEAERLKKEEEARAALEKKQQEELNAQQQQKQLAQRQREMLLAQQQQPNQQNAAREMQMQQLRQRQQAARAQQALMNQSHGHPQQNGVMANQQQNFQQPAQAAITQSSPIVQQQTPMINSSPMLGSGGFPMVQTSSQGAGSPVRAPAVATSQPMVRPATQQQGSRNNTPQIPQGTPAMGQVMPNRQPNQTPRMPAGSPATSMQQPNGTPTTMPMTMRTPQMANQNQFTPEQLQMLTMQQAMSQGTQVAQPNGVSPVPYMTPEQVQSAGRNLQARYNQSQAQLQAQLNQYQAQGNQQAAQAIRIQISRTQQEFKLRQQQMNAQAQMAANAGQAGSPGSVQQPTPQMGHAYPQQQQQNNMHPDPNQVAAAQQRANLMAQQRYQAQLQQAQQQLIQLANQYGGSVGQIPPAAIATLPPMVQQIYKTQVLRNQTMRQQAMRAQANQQQQQQQLGANAEQVTGQPNPQYMQQLRNNQAMLQQQMQSQAQANMNTLGMQSFTMPQQGFAGSPGQQQQRGAAGAVDPLSQQFAAMQNVIDQQNSAQGRQGMQ